MPLDLSSPRLEPAPSLASVVARRLREQIEARNLQIGDAFPTDAQLSKAFGVSRTVVREAVSALREEGLIATQRGRGSVISATKPSRPFGISPQELESLDDVLQVLELRTALEVEAAGLAATRRTDADIVRLETCLERLDAAIAQREDAIESDIDFHMAIAAATHNDYFPRLLNTFRTVYIARRRIRGELDTPEQLRTYLTEIQREHRQIGEAIRDQNVETAKSAMRRHLVGKRYRELQHDVGKSLS